LWQQGDEERRNLEFGGGKWVGDAGGGEGRIEENGAGLRDMVRLLGLGEDRRVEEVMRTDTGLLCYKYKKDI
jgi:hypothetical protein